MIVYSILMILCLIFQFIPQKGKKVEIAYIFMVSLLFLVSAIRYNVGQDYQHWIDIYGWLEKGYKGGEYVEIGYKYLNFMIQNIPFFNAYWLYVITSAFIIFGFGYSIKKNVESKYWFLALFSFIGTGIFFATLNLVRQYIAIVIILLGLPFLIKKKYVRFSIIVFLASLFHTSSYIMLLFMLFYILFTKQKHQKILIIFYIISLMFMVVDIRQFMDKFSFIILDRWKWYLQSDFLTDKNYSAIVKQLVPNIILVFAMLKRKQITENHEIYFLMLYVDIIITNCFYGVLVLLRLSYFFDIALIFMIPIIMDLLKQYNKNIRIVAFLVLIGYYILLTVVTIFIMNGHGVMPYQTLFSLMK